VEPLIVEGSPVSSTLIRTKILEGDLEGACKLLGRRYSLSGSVVPGTGRGRTLGFRTANIDPGGGLVPQNGIYAAFVYLDAKEMAAAVNIGTSPTVKNGLERSVEVHILDFNEELYGSQLEVVFVKKLRDEKKFPDRETLRQQVVRDIEQTRQIISTIRGAV